MSPATGCVLESSILEGWSDPSVDVQFRLIRAPHAEAAYERALILGRQDEHSYENPYYGCPPEWWTTVLYVAFVTVVTLIELGLAWLLLAGMRAWLRGRRR